MQCECGSTVFSIYTDKDTDELLGLNCSECSQEWLKEEYVSDAGTKKIIFNGQEYTQKINTFEKDQGITQVRASRTKLEKDSCCRILQPGDHVTFHRPYVIYHHAIVVKADQLQNSVTVIHYTKCKCDGKIKIIESDINIKKERGDMYRIDYPNEITNKNCTKLVLSRARSRVGEAKYKFLTNNCESFAAFCKTGISECCQCEWFLGKVREATVMSAAKIVTETTKWGCMVARELTKDITQVAVNTGKVGFSEVIEKISKSSNYVGAGIVIVMETGFLVWDLSKMYSKRKNGDMSRHDFIEMAAQRFSEAFGSMGLTIGLGLAGDKLGGLLGGLIGSAICPGVGTAFGVLIGSILGGYLGSIAGRAIGSALGPFVGKAITSTIKTNDRAVKDIMDLEHGDHIVLCAWFLHPRCHAIVVDIDAESTNPKIMVIRNTYKKGVVVEWVAFSKPIYKVIYLENEAYRPGVVIARALSKISQNNYSIVFNNCKDFAKWCKDKRHC